MQDERYCVRPAVSHVVKEDQVAELFDGRICQRPRTIPIGFDSPNGGITIEEWLEQSHDRHVVLHAKGC